MEVIAGRFKLLPPVLGGGGYGDVWRAEDLQLGRQVAVKVLRGGPASHASSFKREARLTAQLEHDHVVRLYDFGSDPNYGNYLVLELVRGKSFNEHLVDLQQASPEKRLLEVALTSLHVVYALTEAHGLNIVHRDVKPANILLSGRHAPYRAKLGDFSIAAMAGEQGTLRSTFAFASPEQLCTGELEPPTDVYSLGVTMYTALSGSVPYRESTPMSQLDAIRERRRKDLAAELRRDGATICELIDGMLSFDARERPSLEVVATTLRRQLASNLTTIDAALAAPPVPPRANVSPSSMADAPTLKLTGIAAMYDSRDRFTADYPLTIVLQNALGGEVLVVGRTLRNVFSWGGALQQALRNGTSIRLCLLHPDAADAAGSGVTRDEITASLAIFRNVIDLYVRKFAPPGRIKLSFHRLVASDSFLRVRKSDFSFAVWQMTASRNRAEKRNFVLDCTVGLGYDRAERYEAICTEAERSALAYSYDRGKLDDRLPIPSRR